MNHDYADIRSRIASEPTWWDERAVPRFCEFSPDMVADIYADEAILVAITCQGCGREFLVAFSKGMLNRDDWPLSRCIKARDVHYGDPPNIGCCASGPTMNSEPRRVVQYWSRHHQEFTTPLQEGSDLRVVSDIAGYITWRRDPSLEVDIAPDWVSKS